MSTQTMSWEKEIKYLTKARATLLPSRGTKQHEILNLTEKGLTILSTTGPPPAKGNFLSISETAKNESLSINCRGKTYC